MFNIQNLSKNVEYSAHWTTHYHPKILQNFVRLKYAFFEEWPNFYTINVHNFFKECSKLYAFNKLHYSKNLHNFVLPKYTIFKWVYTILHLQQMIFLEEFTLLIFNIHNISTNVQKSINSTYTIFQRMFKIMRIQGTLVLNNIWEIITLFQNIKFFCTLSNLYFWLWLRNFSSITCCKRIYICIILFHMFNNNSYYMDDLINNISLGRFSRANVNIAPSTKIKMKAKIIFPMYTELITGFAVLSTGCEPSVPYKK